MLRLQIGAARLSRAETSQLPLQLLLRQVQLHASGFKVLNLA